VARNPAPIADREAELMCQDCELGIDEDWDLEEDEEEADE
jgi:hypothetical protein